ncbi:angiomotin-like protein 1 isoform X2 [Triplophysa rosa]|uniref:angiomotin-like protein 1 isoform X2 n=1 Tax=Triplophysa rosa TaxID=992332 RepID=UPI0025460DB4|nr:angiomotin-like protein 1 isoform X2 [Triplophysa rosa]
MHGSEDSASGTVLQRLMQEHLRYGASGPKEATQGNSSHMPSSPPFTENLEDHLYQSVLPQSQPRQEPQGQEHQVDSSTMEKTAAGVSQGAGGPGFDNVQLPSYEEAKIQSQLYRGQHSPTDLQSQNQGHQSLESHENHQMCLTVSDSPTGSHSCPPSLSSAYSLSSSPSLASLSTSLPAVPVKAHAESRPWFQQGGGASLPDEGLTELKHGHVRSLSERIMQLGLERNGTKQSVGSSGSSSAGDSSHGDESAENSPPAPSSSPKWFLEERGPPPEYPFKFRVQTTLPPSLNTNIGSLDYAHLHNDTLTSAMPEQARPCPVSLGASQQQNSPVSEMCVLPSSQASQQQYQPISQSRALGFPPAQVESVNHGPSVRLAPLGQPFPGEVFAMVSHTQQMLEILKEENQSLKQELQKQNEKASRLQRLELEIERLSETYESLVKSSSKREALDKTMRNKLEGEIRRLHDFNRDLRDRLETANRQLANQELKVQEDGHLYLSQRRESLKDLEKFLVEVASLRSANEDQQHHIDILEQALDNAQSKVVRLEEELSKKQMYVERVERLQQALAQLQAACEKREQLERRLRTRLERELERAGVGVPLSVGESSAPALLDLLREREERILGLEADMTRWEQKYLEESAMRHFAMEAAATAAAQRDRTIIQHSRSGSYSDGSLWQHEDDNRPQSGRRCQEMEQRMKNLHAQLLEKDAMIKVLQQRSRREPAPLRPARSVPSISIATGLHVRQTSQTDRRDQHGWKGSTSVLLGKDTVEHILPSLPLLSVSSVPSPLPPSFSSSLPSSFPPFLASAGSSTSLTRLSSCLPRSSPPSSSSTLPLPSSSSLTPLASFSLPSTPLMSLHSKSASRDSGSQTEMFRAATSTRQHKTESLSGQTKGVEGRAQLSGGQKIALPDLDLLEILI